jgi:hypothetical protein
MDITELEQYSLKDAVQLHQDLNPQLFDGDQLKPDVRRALLRIADDFREYLGLNASQIDDITISGSNAGYTYTPYSDIDLHLIIDMKRLDNDEVYRELFDAKKSLYNDRYDIKVKDSDVELYVQGAADQHHSAGVYSLSRDQWQKMPRRQRVPIDDNTVQAKYKKLGHAIEQAVKNPEYDRLSLLLDKIKRMRKAGLDRAGEFSAENLVFKLLRNRGLIRQLMQARDQAKSEELSIEEAAYAGNIGIMELNEFYRKATAEQKKLLGQLIKQGQQRDVWDLIKRVTGMEIMTEFRWGFGDEPLKEAASGYIPSEAERNDPRFSNALTVDVRPDSLKKAAQQLGFKISRAGVPPRARTNGKLTEGRVTFRGVDSRLSSEINRAIPDILRSLALKPEQVPPVTFTSDRSWARDHNTFGVTQWKNTADDSEVYVYVGDRYLADVLRTYTHELQHVKQFIDGTAHHDMNSQELARVEADANTVAGRVMVDYGRQHDKIFTDIAESYQREKYLDDLAKGVKQLENPNYDNIDHVMQTISRRYDITAQKLHDQWVAKYGVTPDDWARGITAESQDSEDLLEVKMSPGELKKWADSDEAEGIQAGFEAELIFRDAGEGEEEDYEADYDMDERAYSIDGVVDFFQGGDNGIGRSSANRLQQEMRESFYEWRSEQIAEGWNQNADQIVRDYYDENVWPDEQDTYRERAAEELGIDTSEESEEQSEKIEALARELYRADVETSVDTEDDRYDQARDDYFDTVGESSDYDESDWLEQEYRYMSDVGSEFGLDWPYWRGGETSGGDRTVDDIADSLRQALGGDAQVRGSTGYHSVSRKPGLWIIEPDGSLDPDDPSDETGLEVVSPPMPLKQALESLQTVIDWANGDGDAYTNSSTGLHMGVSVPYKGGAVDYVKLIMFLGDQYVLERFGRSANSYARSALSKLQDVQRSRRQQVREQEVTGWNQRSSDMTGAEKTAAAMDLMKKNLIELAADMVRDGVGRDKYTSAHIKDGYIEFRSPGGDYLAKGDEEVGALEDTMLRFARAMYIASRPELERREYGKKLYKLLSGYRETQYSRPDKGTKIKAEVETEGAKDALELFARYSAGLINQEELKKSWARQVLAKEAPPRSRADAKEYEVVNQDTGEVIDIIKDWSLESANETALVKYSGQGFRFTTREKSETEPELSRRAKVAKKIVDRPTLWHVEDTNDRRVIFIAAETAEQAKQLAKQQDAEFKLLAAYDPDSFLVEPATAAEVKQYQEQHKDDKKDREQIQQRVQGTNGQQRYRVQWTERRSDGVGQDSLTVTARNADAAMDSIRSALTAQGRVVTSIEADLEGSTQDLQRQRAQQAQQPAGEFTGQWQIRNANTNEVVHTFGGIGNSQTDANRFAAGWMGRNRPDLIGVELEVVPEMR